MSLTININAKIWINIMNFLLINGSLSKQSHSAALLEYMKNTIEHAGGTAEIHNFIDYPLPFFNPNNQTIDKNTKIFLNKIQNADGYAITTPLYHSSLTGVLKNALDYLPATIFKNKPVALANVGGGIRSGQAACEHLRTIIRSMSGYVVQEQLGCYSGDFTSENNTLMLHDKMIIERAKNLMMELITLAQKLKN